MRRRKPLKRNKPLRAKAAPKPKPWLRADGTPQIVYTQTGPTPGWLEIRLEFALELLGQERAGSYVVQTLVTALRQP